MSQLLGVSVAVLVGMVMLFLRHDAKDRSRSAPDKDGWREPEFLLFDYAGGSWFFATGILAFGVVLVLAVIWKLTST